MASLRERARRLEQARWIDKYSRAVFAEFTVYNAFVNLFAIVTLLAEIGASDATKSNTDFPSGHIGAPNRTAC